MTSHWYLSFAVVFGLNLALTTGCSSNPAPANDGGDTGNVPTDAADVPADVPRADVPTPPPACPVTRALIATSDYMHGGYAVGPIAPLPASLMALAAPAADEDHGVVQSHCIVFELLRGHGEVDVLNPAVLPSAQQHIPLGMAPVGDAGAVPYAVNPQDVLALTPTHVYVAQLA